MQQESPTETDARSRATTKREEIRLICEVRQGFIPWKLVHLEDISQAGFRIAWLPAAELSRPLRIRIPGLQLLTAEIRWQRDKSVGCAFTAPLHIAVFEHIVLRSRAEAGDDPER